MLMVWNSPGTFVSHRRFVQQVFHHELHVRRKKEFYLKYTKEADQVSVEKEHATKLIVFPGKK